MLAKKRTIEAEKITGDNIFKTLFYFDKMYAVMDEVERRHLMESLIDEDMLLSLDNDSHIETVVCLSRGTQLLR